MENILLIFVCLFLGVLLKRLKKFPASTGQSLNLFVIYVSLPALILSALPKSFRSLDLGVDVLLPVAMPWLLFGISFIFFSHLGKKRHWPLPRTGALILTAGLGNTSFVGIPLLDALLGPLSVPYGVLIDQLGSFFALASVGIIVASFYAGGTERPSGKGIAKKVLTFPPFMTMLLALVWGFGQWEAPDFLMRILERLSMTLIPLALVAVGFQLKVTPDVLKRQWRPLAGGLVFKLLAFPAFYFCLTKIVGLEGMWYKVSVLEAAMATMITSAAVASEFGLDDELANLMVGVSIPLSLVSVPLWKALL